MTALAASVVLAGILLGPVAARAITSDQVLVVVNERASGRIAEYYQRARAIPRHHLARIRTAPQEEIDRDTFRRESSGRSPPISCVIDSRIRSS